ncbi:hypothetical protein [Nonomuraea sp. NEAU-A123]|uniref:hypothetical protein n=1 Tax=Nonomuraea sp. NEAU-A123 TaxID=2839649 RepID=UPI001BE40461|nr:hypothetical protein [Nonomuraea sp. NEAU-A123]MBT2233456.1 hypothetical protein [Nonomuraea sp. NEAU-A123]
MADQDERQHRPRDRALVERVRLVRESELKLTEHEDDADARDRAADARDRTADQRDHRTDERDRALEPGCHATIAAIIICDLHRSMA